MHRMVAAQGRTNKYIDFALPTEPHDKQHVQFMLLDELCDKNGCNLLINPTSARYNLRNRIMVVTLKKNYQLIQISSFDTVVNHNVEPTQRVLFVNDHHKRQVSFEMLLISNCWY